MPIARIKPFAKNGVYFVTPTVWNWYYLFDRHNRWQIIADSLRYCKDHKSLKIYAFVFMLNHLHMIIQADDAENVLRDFKRHTSKALKENIRATEPNVLTLFETADSTWRLWKEDNQPQLIESEKFFRQKLDYIHANPVRKDYVSHAEHWKWSSANPNSPLKIEPLSLLTGQQ